MKQDPLTFYQRYIDDNFLILQALAEKEKGNAAYKKKSFESALEHYNSAAQLDPTNITYLTNIAAVYFEQKEFTKCIEQCTKAIEIGRENRADFKLIAKAYTRIGNSYRKLKVQNSPYFIATRHLFEMEGTDFFKKNLGPQKCQIELRKISLGIPLSRC